MACSEIKPGILVSLQDLRPSSPFFKQGVSLRVTGKLQEYSVETAIAIITDENIRLKIDTQHLRNLNLRLGSIYQFIGELCIENNNEATLQARVGRDVDGIDLSLYSQSLQLLRKFQADHLNNQNA
ncbi:hypothetical protein NE237_013945 [Protea cynaroides]|uniref:CST complex subunit TEN1 n=1 Tax=Protea cynaroides TaxID=273540 RepID=A0A9Q0H3Y3_9MAGN|nr:hypothetical protein NE237_013945 [Protea cynaroides]